MPLVLAVTKQTNKCIFSDLLNRGTDIDKTASVGMGVLDDVVDILGNNMVKNEFWVRGRSGAVAILKFELKI